MTNRGGRERREGREDKVINKSPEEINNQHINQNIPHLLNLKGHSLSYEHPRAYMNWSKIGHHSKVQHHSF